jgi:hypothetical protein
MGSLPSSLLPLSGNDRIVNLFQANGQALFELELVALRLAQ